MSRSSDVLREAAVSDADAVWPALRAAHLFETREAFEAERALRPWAVRVSDSGEAVVLTRWRQHLEVLQIRMAWCAPSHVAAMIEQVRAVGAARGLPLLLSPMLEEGAAGPYVRAGLSRRLKLVSYKARPSSLARFEPPQGVAFGRADREDIETIASLEAACFSEFWRQGRAEIEPALDAGRIVVAHDARRAIGYTFTILSRGSATLARVAVHPQAQDRGVGRALVSDAAEFAGQAGASTLFLCTQESNVASRALYDSMGFTQLGGRMVLAADPTVLL